jgi:hypothetical protein
VSQQQLSPKLAAARELIVERNYDAARSLLRTLPNDPTAAKWLAKLDEIAPEVKAPTIPVPTVVKSAPVTSKSFAITTPIFLGGAVIIAIGLMLGVGLLLAKPESPSVQTAVVAYNTLVAFGAQWSANISAAGSQVPPTNAPLLPTVAAARVLPPSWTPGSNEVSVPTLPPSWTPAAPVAYSASKPAVPTSLWSSATEISKLDNTLTISVGTVSDDTTSNTLSSQLVVLDVLCQKTTLAVGIVINGVLDVTNNQVNIRYKFDNGPTYKIVANAAPNMTTFYILAATGFVEQMRTHSSLTVGYPVYLQGEVEKTFALTGLPAALAPMAGHCGQ